MGQRQQIFLHTDFNPIVKLTDKLKALSGRNPKETNPEIKELKEQIVKFQRAFGNKPNSTIYAFHAQWLFGRSSLIACNNILSFLSNVSQPYENPFSNENNFSADEVINQITNILSMFNNKIAKLIGRFGIERFHLLNFSENYMKDDFTRGDNNDGVLIISTILKRYCYLNIGGDSTINQLPLLEPVSAECYVKLYYPETPDDSLNNQPEGTPEEIAKQYLQNKRLNRLFTKPFQSYEVLTTKELKKIFPDVYKKKVNSNEQGNVLQ